MRFKNFCPWRAMISLQAFICGALGQTSSNDMTSDMTSAMTSITHWTKCAPTTDDNKLRSIALIPFHLCQKECELRTNCVGVNYWPRGKVCDLLSSIHALESNLLYGKPCIHAAAHTTNPKKCDCSANEVCEPETGSCEVQECPVPHVPKATLYGNLNAVGSKVKVDCASGYDVELPMICEQTGNWSNSVVCGCPDPCPTLSHATLQSGGVHAGDTRKYECMTGYTTPEGELQFSVTCSADLTWSTTGFCGNATDSDVAPTKNVTDYINDYVTVGCQILKFSTYIANHSLAKSACEPYGNLVRIDSAEKQAAIIDYVIAHALLQGYAYWIQGKLDIADGIWKYDDGTPMVYSNWAPGTPDGPWNAYCVRMMSWYTWNDRECSYLWFRFICELLE